MKLVIEFRTVSGCPGVVNHRTFHSHQNCMEQLVYEAKKLQDESKMPTSNTLAIHELDIDPEAGYQCCEAFQLHENGRHQIDVELDEIEAEQSELRCKRHNPR